MNGKALAFFAASAIGFSAVMMSSADARMGGGFGGGHMGGGFGGGHMGGFGGGHMGGFGGGHMGGFGGGQFGGVGDRMMGMGPVSRGPAVVSFHGARFNHMANFRGARFNHVRFDHNHRHFVAAPFFGFPAYAAYDAGYYDNCLVRIWTPYGWTWRNSCDYYGYGY